MLCWKQNVFGVQRVPATLYYLGWEHQDASVTFSWITDSVDANFTDIYQNYTYRKMARGKQYDLVLEMECFRDTKGSCYVVFTVQEHRGAFVTFSWITDGVDANFTDIYQNYTYRKMVQGKQCDVVLEIICVRDTKWFCYVVFTWIGTPGCFRNFFMDNGQ